MGLDITVDATVGALVEAIKSESSGDRMRKDLALIDRIYAGPSDEKEPIHTRPGSYSGLHRVRVVYAKQKGWDLAATGTTVIVTDDSPSSTSHLVNHSDADGYYLPWDFQLPLWPGDGLSIGSSNKLLAELREIEDVEMGDLARHAWNAVYVPALASVLCRKVIYFH